MTQPFKSDIGVRQGVVLIPNIFKFFLNDLNISIESSGIGTTLFNTNIGCLLYADDLVFFKHTLECFVIHHFSSLVKFF
jgi:hypothetical protein